jgi:hypothetical protein
MESRIVGKADVPTQDIKDDPLLLSGRHHWSFLVCAVTPDRTTRTKRDVTGIAQRPRTASAQH